MSRDRVGIVADVTRAVESLGGTVDASSQTVLKGYFTLILTAGFAEKRSAEDIRAAVERAGAPGELAVSVKAQEPDACSAARPPEDQFVLTVVGSAHPGILCRISSHLASRNINIVDLYCYTQGEEFVMIGQLAIPKRLDVRQIQIDLEGLFAGRDLAIRLQHEDIFVATNEIEFRHAALRRG